MQDLQILILTAFIAFSLGVVSTLILSKRELTLAQIVALLFLAMYMGVILHSRLEQSQIDFYIHAGGIASLFTLLGLEAPQIFGQLSKKK